jgi:hypothetical protein
MDRWTEQDKAQRARLEKQSPSAGRRDLAGIINSMVTQDAASEMAGIDAILGIRKAQRLSRRTASDHNRAYEIFERAAAEGFNRLHPQRKPAAPAPVDADRIGPDDAHRDRIGPDLEAKRLLDAAGALASGDPRAKDHWPSGQPEAIAAEWLLTAARALVAAERERQVQEAAHDLASARIPLSGRR